MTQPDVLFGAEDESPIGSAGFIFGHRDAGRAHVRKQQVVPMAGAFLPAAQDVAEGFLPRGDILRGDLGMIAGSLSTVVWP